MFDSKKKQLFEVPKKKEASGNSFTQTATRTAAETRSGNNSLKYASTGNPFTDQFASVGMYKQPRSYAEIEKDMGLIWSINARMCVALVFYIRLISRIVSFFDNTKTAVPQRGAGLKHEGIFRMIWIGINFPSTFWKNINLFVSVGSWKDIFTMLSYDLQYNGWDNRKLDWVNFGKLIMAGLENPNTLNLVKKYLPQIRANSVCTTVEAQADNMIAKWICSLLFGTKETWMEKEKVVAANNGWGYKKYRKLKTAGSAHSWQQLISKRKFLEIDFNTIHGRALAQLVSSKFLKNQNLEATYDKWISSKPIAKFTGYVHELGMKLSQGLNKDYVIKTINAQYEQLLETARKGATQNIKSFIVVRDTSTSMNSRAHGINTDSFTIAKAISIFMSEFLRGDFHNCIIDFSSEAQLRKVIGNNFNEKWKNLHRDPSANTNFIGVADLFNKIRQKGARLEDFPTGIICVSDGEFDRTKMFDTTNIDGFKNRLRSHFPKEFIDSFTFVFWDIRNEFYGPATNRTKFETWSKDGVFYFGGFDPSVIAFLTGVEGQSKAPENNEQLLEVALNQEVMHRIEL